MKATKIKEFDCSGGSASSQVLYKVSPPMVYSGWSENENTEYEYVVSSAALVMFTGPETYIFGANKEGEIVNWSSLYESRGYMDPDRAIREAGYEIQ